jgi:branched-chain amino acid transport system ATP-binding protein
MQNSKKVVLEFDKVEVYYGSVQAISNVSFQLSEGEILTLIGANGAGKSTVLRAISGLVKTTSGEIRHKGSSLRNLKAHDIVKRHICHVPEGRGIFLNLTVEENIDLGAWVNRSKKNYKDDLAYVFELFPRLKERAKQNAGTLSGGEQQMLAIGRALMGDPDILLLDEPSLGLAPQMIETIFEIIQKINKQGKTVLLVEQNALQALEIADHGVVLETGRVAAKGNARELLALDTVRQAYLGG